MPPQESSPITSMPEKPKSHGALVVTIIALLVLVAGAFYFYQNYQKEAVAPAPANNVSAEKKPAVSATEMNEVQTDIDGTDFDNLDQGL